MKRFYGIGISLLLLMGGFLQGQKYEPMVVEDSHWIGAYFSSNAPDKHLIFYEDFIQGDTIVNGLAYKKVYSRSLTTVNGNSRYPFLPDKLGVDNIALLREDTVTRKVYTILLENPNTGNQLRLGMCSDQEFILYDFSMEKGDTALECVTINFRKVDTVIRVGKPIIAGLGRGSPINEFDSLTRWNLTDSPFMMEAIGGSSGLFYELYNHPRGNYVEHYCRGNSCDSLIFPNPNLPLSRNLENSFWEIYPNPAKEKITISYSGNKNTQAVKLRICDIAGKSILELSPRNFSQKKVKWDTSQLKTGIYFLEIFVNEQFVRKKILIGR